MKVYLAARYGRREEISDYAAQLTALGFGVTSRWLNGMHETPPEGIEPESHEHLQWCATDDIEDILVANVLIAFTEPEGSVAGRGRGGRHVELGYALGIGTPVIVCGYRENVFCHLPGVVFAETWEDASSALCRMSPDMDMDHSSQSLPVSGDTDIQPRERMFPPGPRRWE